VAARAVRCSAVLGGLPVHGSVRSPACAQIVQTGPMLHRGQQQPLPEDEAKFAAASGSNTNTNFISNTLTIKTGLELSGGIAC